MRDLAMTLQGWRSVIDRVDQALKDVGEAVAEIREGGDDRDRDT